jgi:hypothetical protein
LRQLAKDCADSRESGNGIGRIGDADRDLRDVDFTGLSRWELVAGDHSISLEFIEALDDVTAE